MRDRGSVIGRRWAPTAAIIATAVGLGGCGGAHDAPDAPASDAAPGVCLIAPPPPAGCDAPGGPSPATVSIPVAELVADPPGCRVYARAADAVLVIEVATARELAIIATPGARDLDMPSDGGAVVVARGAAGLTVLEGCAGTVRTVPTAAAAERVRAAAGRAFYVTATSGDVHRVDLATGADTQLAVAACPGCEPALTADGDRLYLATTGVTPPRVDVYDVRGDGFALIDSSGPLAIDAAPTRHALLSPDGQRLWLARAQLDATAVATVRGVIPDPVVAEEPARRLAVGQSQTYDSLSLFVYERPPYHPTTGTFVAGGREFWGMLSDTVMWRIASARLGGAAP